MNRKSKLPGQSILWFVATLALLVACGDKKTEEAAKEKSDKAKEGEESPGGLTPEQAAKVVAKVGERTITVGEITSQINKLSPYIRRRWAAPEKRKEFLDNMIRVELLSQEAERLGLGKDDPEVQRTVNQVLIRLMIKNDLEKELIPSEIDEATLKKSYEDDKGKYQRPPQVRASQIVVKTKAEAEKILADLKEHKKDNRYFREKARELSIDEDTKKRGGDIGYLSEKPGDSETEPEVDPAVRQAVWQLKDVGDLSEKVVETKKGFHIVRLTNKRPELNRTFDSVKKMIESRLLREKRREALDKFVADLQAKAKVEIYKENLAKIDLKMRGGPPMPGHRPPQRPGMSKRPGPPTKIGKPAVKKTAKTN
jgi:peptidyl-prolyl cis-trans isomerase C